MSLESTPAVESVECGQASSASLCVSMDDWSKYDSCSKLGEKTQSMVEEGSLPRLDFSAGQDDADRLFDVMDANKDGLVCESEFFDFIRGMMPSVSSQGGASKQENCGDPCAGEAISSCDEGAGFSLGKPGQPQYETAAAPFTTADYPQEGGYLEAGWEGGSLQSGKGAVTIADTIPPELQKYARMEGDTLVIDAQGNQLPPLDITRDNVVIKNARIAASGRPSVRVSGSNVSILNNEITGGTRGVLAESVSNLTVEGNYFHDFGWNEKFDTTAVEFDHVKGGKIANNKFSGNYQSDVISMFGSNNLKVMYNDLNVTISEPSSAPLMVEGGDNPAKSHDIEVAYNNIVYSGSAHVPPGLLGGYNLSGHDNVVNGDTSRNAWQLYAYNSLWQNIYYNGERIA